MAAVGPHAGWMFCGTTLALAVRALADRGESPETVVCFGAVHSALAARPAVWAKGAWETPLGDAEVDEPLAGDLLRRGRGLVVDDPRAHAREHSIEVQLPLIREAFPRARILPIAVPPTPDAVVLGGLVAESAEAAGGKVVAFGSTDLTHYGMGNFGWAPAGGGAEAIRWVREENDPPVIDAMRRLDADGVLAMRGERRNSCGAGAVAAAIAFARKRGAKRGVLVDYSTSADGKPDRPPDDFVTYAGVVFEGD